MSSTQGMNDGGPPPDKRGSGIEDLWKEKPVRILAVVLACILTVVMIGAASAATVFTATAMFDGKRAAYRMHGNDDSGPGQGSKRRFHDWDRNNGGGSSGSTPSTPDLPDVPGMPGMPGMGAGLSSLQHGDLVMDGPTGQAVTKRFVRGTVTAISGATVTVTATDGYAANFVTSASTVVRGNGSSSTVSSLTKGSSVLAIGTVVGKVVKADLFSVQ